MFLNQFSSITFDRGASRGKEALWLLFESLLFSSLMPGSAWRRFLLRAFGARIGKSVVIKPGVSVKFPWRLTVGDHSWIGERVWIDNLAEVKIGSHACLSQGVYLCTGSHDWSRVTFDLIVKPITIGDHVWICAKAILAPGVVVEDGAVLSLAAVGQGRLTCWMIYGGNPAHQIRPRTRQDSF